MITKGVDGVDLEVAGVVRVRLGLAAGEDAPTAQKAPPLREEDERAGTLEIIGSRLPQDEPQLTSRLVKVRAYERGS